MEATKNVVEQAHSLNENAEDSSLLPEEKFYEAIFALNVQFKDHITQWNRTHRFSNLFVLFEEYRKHLEKIYADTMPGVPVPKYDLSKILKSSMMTGSKKSGADASKYTVQSNADGKISGVSTVKPPSTSIGATKETTVEKNDEETDEESGSEESESEAPEKAGITTLQANKEIISGEENENTLATGNVKLFRFKDGNYTGLGLCTLKVNQDINDTSKSRIICRAEGTNRIMLNSRLYSKLNVKEMGTSGKDFQLLLPVDDEFKVYLFRAHSKEQASRLIDAIRKCVSMC
jgi:hypothetical protein